LSSFPGGPHDPECGRREDRVAVRAALHLPWSSGQAEGQINRLKLLKRSMHGRAKLDLLRGRFLVAI
jgi:transposase